MRMWSVLILAFLLLFQVIHVTSWRLWPRGFLKNNPPTSLAVTGTNGKTSVASFVQQIWQTMGINGASLGTVGIQAGDQHWPLSHTTPDPIELHEKLAMLVDEGVTHLAIEASSHGLEQRRLEGVQIDAAAFTNITQDHLDYHGSIWKNYFAQKLRLFAELLPDGASVVVDSDIEGSQVGVDIAKQRGFKVISVGRNGQTLLLEDLHLSGYGQNLHVRHQRRSYLKLKRISLALFRHPICWWRQDCAWPLGQAGKISGKALGLFKGPRGVWRLLEKPMRAFR